MAENLGIPRAWRIREQRYNLVGEICTDCGEIIFPPRDVCSGCSLDVSGLRIDRTRIDVQISVSEPERRSFRDFVS